MKIISAFNTVKVKLREKTNPILSKYRRRKLKNEKITIISNNCWAGHEYRYFGLPYMSPTIGLYFYADDFIKFCSNLKYYLSQELKFIPISESKHNDPHKDCPLGVIDDIEIVFLHYASEKEAKEKWERRIKRMNWDNIYIKMSEQNKCEKSNIMAFEKLPYEHKFVLVTQDYKIKDQVFFWRKSC